MTQLTAQIRRGRAAAGCGLRRGFTLLELLMVMLLLALIFGVGVGSLSTLDLGSGTAGSLVRSTLRATGNWSRARQAPARVRINLAEGSMLAEGLMVVGTWHFESLPPRGAFGLNGQMYEGLLDDDGFVGKCLGFNGAPDGASYEIPVNTDPAFALQDGFQVQAMLRPEGPSQGNIFELGDALKIEATRSFGLKVSIATQRFDEETQRLLPAGRAKLSTDPGVLAPGEWNRVLITYDRANLNIYVEDLLVASLAEEGLLMSTKDRLVLGGGQRPWEGSLDNLVVSAVGAQEELFLPDGVRFREGTPKRIVFAADGGLDRNVYRSPVVFDLEYDDGRRETIRVNLYGTVE